jgi:two-component system nitrogen regulation response regulator GlnG
MSRILVVDDEPSICWAFRESLSDEGHTVDVAPSAEEGLRIASATTPDVLVLDVRLPGIDGLSAIAAFREKIGPAPIIVITAFGDLETAVRTVQAAAFEYLVKPFDLDQATAVIKRALEKQTTNDRTKNPPPANSEALIGRSPAMQELFKNIALVAPTDVPVLITGESGTGKELVARAIHRHSPRKTGPFLPVTLAALSPNLVERELFGHVKGSFTGASQDRSGLLELAGTGTVLLDEIGDVPPNLQVKLLRAIEQREVTPVGDARPRPINVRFIAATNRPLPALMAAGEFREDLFFRLSVFRIHLPPLRDRREDIPDLAQHFLRLARPAQAVEQTLSSAVLDHLQSQHWSGNVRELRNAIEHAAIVARGYPLRPEHLPPPSSTTEPPAEAASTTTEIQTRLAAWARQECQKPADSQKASIYERFLELAEPPIIQATYDHSGHNGAAAAQLLGIHRATLRQKLKRYSID